MRKLILPQFFARPALEVAPELLGKFLVRRLVNEKGEVKEIALMINEVEAYTGADDLACHASKGRTPRCEALFGEPGHFYIYFVYGMHFMLNIVTDKKDHPAGVLIRGAGDLNGPAKLTKFLKIDKRFYGKPAIKETELWCEDRGVEIEKKKIKKTPRIGVDYAPPKWKNKPYRFVLKKVSAAG